MPSRIFGVRIPSHAGHVVEKDNATKHTVTEIPHPMDHLKRSSIGPFGLGKRQHSHDKPAKSKDRSASKGTRDKDGSPAPVARKAISLDMIMESPPVLFIDNPQQSTGALISGRLQITPTSGDVTLSSIIMYLECTTTTSKPVEQRCRECSSQVTDLYEWDFLSKPKTFATLNGTQDMPFSHVIPGHLPATTHGKIGSIDYSLHVRAKTSEGQETEFRRELQISRAIRPGPEKHSVRIFPPTNLNLRVTLPNIVHPIGDFPVECRMTGITSKREETQTRWRLKKLSWRIEEKETMISPACSKHASKIGGEGKGVQYENTREVGSDELKQGWKTDFDDGQIEGEFMAWLDSSLKPQCGVDAPNGLKIVHVLVMELVIAEEWAPNKKPQQATPTGAARVLRTQFSLNVTQRAGLGIAWDDEMPPMYEDVPASPPHYHHGENLEYHGTDLDEDVERLNLSP